MACFGDGVPVPDCDTPLSSQYLEALTHAKQLVESTGRRTYTFVVGKLNVPKLANFLEIDVFVLVAAAEYSLMIDTDVDGEKFLKPVATPFELEVALNPAMAWTGDYITDFRELLRALATSHDAKDGLSQPAQLHTGPAAEAVAASDAAVATAVPSPEDALVAFGSRALSKYHRPV